jgi:hypothetical protein
MWILLWIALWPSHLPNDAAQLRGSVIQEWTFMEGQSDEGKDRAYYACHNAKNALLQAVQTPDERYIYVCTYRQVRP